MKISFLKKSFIAASVGIVTAIAIAFACIDEYFPSSRYSSFAPEIAENKEYSPLFYQPFQMFYNIGYDEEHITRFNEDVTNDWYLFFNKKMDKEAISSLLLSDETNAELLEITKRLSNGETNIVNSWQLDFNDKKTLDFILFTFYVKQVDAALSPRWYAYSWTYQKEAPKEEINPDFMNQLNVLFNNNTDPFLKNRYWFLLLKIYFYTAQSDEFKNFFESTKNEMPRNTLYYRAMGYLASIYYAEKKTEQANLLYAEIFEKEPALRTVATVSFKLQSEKQWSQTLQMAKNIDEKIALWTLFGYYADEERAITEIYKLKPNSKSLDLLLTRIINKREKNGEIENEADVFNMIRKIADKEKISSPFLWYIASGYISTWQNKAKLAQNYYTKAEKYLPKSKLASEQLRLLRLDCELSTIKSIRNNNVEKLTDELNWLFFADKTEELRTIKIAEQTKEYLAELYAKSGNTIYSQLLNHTDDFFTQPQNIDDLILFLEKTNKSKFEQLLQKIYPISVENLYHYKATMAAYSDDLDNAISYMQKTGDLSEIVLRANPFNGLIREDNDAQYRMKQRVKYTSLSFLQKMREMKQKVLQNDDVYNNSLLLGNGYYNITFYGTERFFFLNDLISDGATPSSPNQIPCFAQKKITDCSLAKTYYQKAFDAAENDEQRAKAAFMMAKCERNQAYNKEYGFNNCKDVYQFKTDSWEYDIEDISYDFNGFELLKNNYANTEYYQDVINECGYFRYYVKTRK